MNVALRLIKAKRITSLVDGSDSANAANDVYVETRDNLLRAHNWNFASKWVTLARISTAPAFQFDHAYALPSDWIRTIGIFDNDAGVGAVNYQEGEVNGKGVILTSVETIFCNYVYRVTDPNRMASDFRTALSIDLALAMPGISNLSAAREERLVMRASTRLRKAKSSDALGAPQKQRPRGSWANSRGQWPQSRAWPG